MSYIYAHHARKAKPSRRPIATDACEHIRRRTRTKSMRPVIYVFLNQAILGTMKEQQLELKMKFVSFI